MREEEEEAERARVIVSHVRACVFEGLVQICCVHPSTNS